MKIVEPKTYLIVWLSVMLGFGLSLGLSQVNIGFFGIAVPIVIAFAQAILVILYFMHVRYSTRLVWLFSLMGFYWLGVIFVLGLNDYLSRGWVGFWKN